MKAPDNLRRVYPLAPDKVVQISGGIRDVLLAFVTHLPEYAFYHCSRIIVYFDFHNSVQCITGFPSQATKTSCRLPIKYIVLLGLF